MFGLASTSVWCSALPMALTMPSPTRAMMVSSVAPPTRRSSLVRTVTPAWASKLDAVLADAVERGPALGGVGAVDDLGIDAGLDGVEDVAAGQVDGRRRPPGQVHAGLVGGDDRRRRLGHVAARQVVGFHLPGGDLDAGLHQGDLLPHDHGVIDVAQLHADEVQDADLGPGQQALHPQAQEAEEDHHADQAEDHEYDRGPQHDDLASVDGRRVGSQKKQSHERLLTGWRLIGNRLSLQHRRPNVSTEVYV